MHDIVFFNGMVHVSVTAFLRKYFNIYEKKIIKETDSLAFKIASFDVGNTWHMFQDTRQRNLELVYPCVFSLVIMLNHWNLINKIKISTVWFRFLY